jgi:hypothetical protein
VPTEQLALLNTMAVEIGYSTDDLPFPADSSLPSRENIYGESIGFELIIPLMDTLSIPSILLNNQSQLRNDRGWLEEDEVSVEDSAECLDEQESRFDLADNDDMMSVACDRQRVYR